MKLPCKFCGEMPVYKYGDPHSDEARHVALQCPLCKNVGPAKNSDPTALKYWNEENEG